MENYLVGARFLTSTIDFPDSVMCFYFFPPKPNLYTSNQVIKSKGFDCSYSRTSLQRPPWGQKKVAVVERCPLLAGRVVIWQFFFFYGVQPVFFFCATFMLTVSHDHGNPIRYIYRAKIHINIRTLCVRNGFLFRCRSQTCN